MASKPEGLASCPTAPPDLSPSGKAPPPDPARGRFAILEHVRAGVAHWDLLLDSAEAERIPTWQIHVSPDQWIHCEGGVPATRLPDHRRMYLTYEGPIPGDRGVVRRVDDGPMRLILAQERRWRVELRGTMPRLDLLLERAEPEAPADRWILKVRSAAG